MADETTDTITKEAPAKPVEAASEVPEEAAKAPTPKPKKKKAKRTVSAGQVHIYATFNNTIITITDSNGGALASSSAGACGFRGSKKGTAYAAQVAAEKALNTARQQYGFSKADVYIKGIGLGREAAVRVMAASNIDVDSIRDVTGIPHGGCRPKKARRV